MQLDSRGSARPPGSAAAPLRVDAALCGWPSNGRLRGAFEPAARVAARDVREGPQRFAPRDRARERDCHSLLAMASGDEHERLPADPRFLAIHEMRLDGMTLGEIAQTIDLTRGYIHKLWRAGATPQHIEQLRQAEAAAKQRAIEQRRAASERRRKAAAALRAKRRRKATRRRLLADMREWERRVGQPPSAGDWDSNVRRRSAWRAERYASTGRRWPTSANVLQRFGSWNAAIRAAGFAPRPAPEGSRRWHAARARAVSKR